MTGMRSKKKNNVCSVQMGPWGGVNFSLISEVSSTRLQHRKKINSFDIFVNSMDSKMWFTNSLMLLWILPAHFNSCLLVAIVRTVLSLQHYSSQDLKKQQSIWCLFIQAGVIPSTIAVKIPHISEVMKYNKTTQYYCLCIKNLRPEMYTSTGNTRTAE